MPVCMEAVVTKMIYTTDYEGMPIRAKSQVIIFYMYLINKSNFYIKLMLFYCFFADKSGNETTSDSDGQ